jgi:hypothetical protein
VDSQECRVFAADFPYDIIVGRNFLRKIGMVLDFETMTLNAFGNTISMKSKNFHTNPFESLIKMVQNYDHYDDDEDISSSFHAATKTIKESTYKKADLNLLAKQQDHLLIKQNDRLLSMLSKRSKLFSDNSATTLARRWTWN